MRCLLVLAILVTAPVALAGPDQKARLYAAPVAREISVEGTPVRVGVDRLLAANGENVQLQLAATQRVTVAVVLVGPVFDGVHEHALGLHGRTNVPLEPGRVSEVPVRLDGVHGALHATFDRYAILVLSRAAADALEQAPPADAQLMVDTVRAIIPATAGADANLFGRDRACAVDTFAHARSSAIALAMPDKVERDAAFTVAVTVTNTTRERIEGMNVGVQFAPVGGGYLGMAPRDVTVAPMFGHSLTLAPGASTRVEFVVSGLRTGVIGIAARLDWIGDHVDGVEPLVRGAFDAVEIVPAPRDVIVPVSKR